MLFALLVVNSIYLGTVSLLQWLEGASLEGPLYQSMFLGHLALGFAIALPAILYAALHLRRAIHRPNRLAIRLGLALFAVVLLLIGSGIALTRGIPVFELRGEFARSIVYWLHVAAPFAAVWLFVLHRLAGPRIRWLAGGAIALAGIAVGVAAAWLAEPAAIEPAQAEVDFSPSLARTATGHRIPAGELMRDDYCARCHAGIHAQWQHSAHRLASFNNPAYLFSVRNTREMVLARDGDVSAARFCAGCHDPVPLFSGAFDDPAFDDVGHPTAHAGITCVSCHAIERLGSPRGNADYVIGVPRHYPFAFSDNAILKWINGLSIKSNPDLHKRSFLKPPHRTAEFCGACHKGPPAGRTQCLQMAARPKPLRFDVTDDLGVAGATDAWSTGAAFFDHDGDGDLDLFVCNYVRWSPDIDREVDYRLTGVGRAYGPPTDFAGVDNYLFRNEGDRFTDVSAESGVRVSNPATGAPEGKALAVLPVDANGDRWLDLAVANDTVRNFLFLNRGDGSFQEAGIDSGIAFDTAGLATGAMGIDAAHFANDNRLAIAIGNFANEMTSFYVARAGANLFSDDAIVAGIGADSRRALTFGLLFLDADLDGRMDLFAANGHVEPEIAKVQASQSYAQPAQLFWNCGADCARPFQLVGGTLDTPLVGRGAAYADIDADGDLDLALTQVGGPAVLLRNDQRLGNRWLRLKLQAPPPNAHAIGARYARSATGVGGDLPVSRMSTSTSRTRS